MQQQSAYTGSTMKGFVVSRPLMNQPSGYSGATTKHYCRHHNYTHYSMSWDDPQSGKHYDAGYYDENGNYYSDIAFRRDNKYQNVVAVCPYCSNRVHLDWEKGMELKCQSCGAPMEIETALDEYTQDPAYTNNTMGKYSDSSQKKPISSTTIAVIAVLIFIFSPLFSIGSAIIGLITTAIFESASLSSSSSSSDSYTSNIDIYGTTLYLNYKGDSTYELLSSSTDDYTKKLTWDYKSEGYYDAQTECWIWYNTEVVPNLWQYWYEGISSAYPDYGWMEYEPTGWYIEVSDGNWQKYDGDTSRLWHLEIDARDFETYYSN